MPGRRTLTLDIPAGTTAVLIVDERERLKLEKGGADVVPGRVAVVPGKRAYIIHGGTKLTVALKHT